MTSEQASVGRLLAGATLLFLVIVLGAVWVSDDPTPLLTTPSPDLRVPLGLAGAAGGVAAAKWMTEVPYIRDQAKRWVLFVALPLYLGFGLASASERLFELTSFRDDVGVPDSVIVRVIDKSHPRGRRGDRYTATILSPFGGRRLSVELDRALFDRLEPARDCLALAVERAPNGAVRLIERPRLADRAPPLRHLNPHPSSARDGGESCEPLAGAPADLIAR